MISIVVNTILLPMLAQSVGMSEQQSLNKWQLVSQ